MTSKDWSAKVTILYEWHLIFTALLKSVCYVSNSFSSVISKNIYLLFSETLNENFFEGEAAELKTLSTFIVIL